MSHVPVGRLAPSPTGRLHLGHARSFLLAWWHVRSRGGRIVLRMEDLDETRLRPGMVETAYADLEWLGLDWDGPVLHQSSDPEPYATAVAKLLESGDAYPCVCSRKDIQEALSAPHTDGGETPYPGTCRGRFESRAQAEAEAGRPAGVRLRVPPGPVTVEDGIHGAYTKDTSTEVGDFLLLRRDGAVAYQLAVVVDDARQGVNEVLRGDDLLSSAVRQLHLQRALGLPPPTWFHVPLVLGPDGHRLAKRHGSLALADLRAAGADPRQIVAWAARTSGQGAPESLAAEDLLPTFDLVNLPRTPVRLTESDLTLLQPPS